MVRVFLCYAFPTSSVCKLTSLPPKVTEMTLSTVNSTTVNAAVRPWQGLPLAQPRTQ